MKIGFQTKSSATKITTPADANRRIAGHTLAQVLAAGSILGLIVVAFSGAFATGFCVIQSTRADLQASQVVMERAESLRLYNWQQVSGGTKAGQPLFVEGQATGNVSENAGCVQHAAYLAGATPVAGASAKDAHAHMRNVTLTLRSTTSNGDKSAVHTSQFQTRLARNGAPKFVWTSL